MLKALAASLQVTASPALHDIVSGARRVMLALACGLALSACTTSSIDDAIDIDPAQGSEANITSLSAVVDRNPNSPEAYNVRGTATTSRASSIS